MQCSTSALPTPRERNSGVTANKRISGYSLISCTPVYVWDPQGNNTILPTISRPISTTNTSTPGCNSLAEAKLDFSRPQCFGDSSSWKHC
ncbi:hypothetical protein B481_0776 [Planococcus halocryophilus Or1]|nr:hypothetical protein B481_0776 [Planococcus halocryophilus Or1]